MPTPITLDDVQAARDRLAPYLTPTPLRQHPPLDAAVPGLALFVKHENVQPTGSFKVRNGLATITALGPAERAAGVVGATTGNHGLGLAYAGRQLGVPVTICVPRGNNPEKNAALRAWGARVVEEGADYDDAVAVAQRLVETEGRTLAHSTNNPQVLAGAGTMSLEIVEQVPDLDVVIIAIGGGSQAVGAITVARALRPSMRVIGVQAAGAPAGHDGWHARAPRRTDRAATFAEGVATRSTYELTFPTLLDGLAQFITVTDAEIADAVRLILSTTHHLVEGAGAMGVAAARKLAAELQGQRVGVIFCGGNMDSAVLRRILNGETVR
ncbi:MAG: threonine/serine dehydratase [Gemmatimonadaceae bacterium]|nr:threonine/serine dehydratase [Gemmatimonadaceae bacterium]NUO95218.1 threonine/serine dehydratase [Gemmatimonadaceae bacterium]NUP57698.1 threonine/serine dehydratase [Gemmatimonadaceae bacterium]NUP71723.1 threonine/serine dehydratase [Gemmatimonadaceae bacterium]NUS34633.1 threonine/serine dehydratase [Gemmatimonadaceae bacterium]